MSSKLEWPSGWPRTRPGDRKARAGWKKPESIYRRQLEQELAKMKGFGIQISVAPPELQRLDPGVVVYFSLEPKENYSWQDILELFVPAPTPEQISEAYVKKAKIYHPDIKPTGDLEMFQRVEQAKRDALKYISQRDRETYQHCLPCDIYKEVRWNLAGLRLAVSYLRGLDRVGIPGFLERGLKGYAALTEGQGKSHVNAAAATRSL